ncbi:hypothetical protein BT69DRAFT_1290875 [Atractiella rhizophila]|nr:hypothetical protein BT69DRAFT_1290875 [Atractiella rhizophila]
MTAQLAQLRIQNVNRTSAPAHRDRARRSPLEHHRPPRLRWSVRVTALVSSPQSFGPSKDASAV